MKALLMALILSSTSLYACPDLSGEYGVCRSKYNLAIESTNLVVKQSQDQFTSFTFDSLPDGNNERSVQEFIANGKTIHTTWTSETGHIFESAVTAICKNNKLYVDSQITSEGENWKSDITVISKVGDTLVHEIKGTVGSLAYKDTLTCH